MQSSAPLVTRVGIVARRASGAGVAVAVLCGEVRTRGLHLWGFGGLAGEGGKDGKDGKGDKGEGEEDRMSPADRRLYEKLTRQLAQSLRGHNSQAAWDAYSRVLDDSLDKLNLSVWDHRTLLQMLESMPPRPPPPPSLLQPPSSTATRTTNPPKQQPALPPTPPITPSHTVISLMRRVLSDMRARGNTPTPRDVAHLVRGLADSGDWKAALDLVETGAQQLSTLPDERCITQAVEGCVRAGEWKEAVAFLARCEERARRERRTFQSKSESQADIGTAGSGRLIPDLPTIQPLLFPFPTPHSHALLLRTLARTSTRSARSAALSHFATYLSTSHTRVTLSSADAAAVCIAAACEAAAAVVKDGGEAAQEGKKVLYEVVGWTVGWDVEGDVDAAVGGGKVKPPWIDPLSPVGTVIRLAGVSAGPHHAPTSTTPSRPTPANTPTTTTLTPSPLQPTRRRQVRPSLRLLEWHSRALLDASLPAHALAVCLASLHTPHRVPDDTSRRALAASSQVFPITAVPWDVVDAAVSVVEGMERKAESDGGHVASIAAVYSRPGKAVRDVTRVVEWWNGVEVDVHAVVEAACKALTRAGRSGDGCAVVVDWAVRGGRDKAVDVYDKVEVVDFPTAITAWRSLTSTPTSTSTNPRIQIPTPLLLTFMTALSQLPAADLLAAWDSRLLTTSEFLRIDSKPSSTSHLLSSLVSALIAHGRPTEAQGAVLVYYARNSPAGHSGSHLRAANLVLGYLASTSPASAWRTYNALGAGATRGTKWGDVGTLEALVGAVVDVDTAAKMVEVVEGCAVKDVPRQVVKVIGKVLDKVAKEGGDVGVLKGWVGRWKERERDKETGVEA